MPFYGIISGYMTTEIPAQFNGEDGEFKTDWSEIIGNGVDVSSCTQEFLQGLAKERCWHIEVYPTPVGQKALIWRKVVVWPRKR